MFGSKRDIRSNRVSKSNGTITETYTVDNANKLTGVSWTGGGSKSYTYDSAGNMTSVTNAGVTTNLTWDAESRLKTAAVGGSTTTNTHNGLGQRVRKVEGGTTYNYTLNDDGIDAPVLDDGAASYTHGIGLVSENRSGTSKYLHSDALGTTRAWSNSAGTKTDSLDTDAFGMVVASSGSTPKPFGFAGQHGYQSDSTGLQRLGHRYYDASTGRFISRDPIRDGYNWYNYCAGDPVNGVDPQGLLVINIGIGGGMTFGVGVGVEIGIALEIPFAGGKKWNLVPYAAHTEVVGPMVSLGIGGSLGVGTGHMDGFLGISPVANVGLGAGGWSVSDSGVDYQGVTVGVGQSKGRGWGFSIGEGTGVSNFWDFFEDKGEEFRRRVDKFFRGIGLY
jgi:RHS repeat-associated protein